MLLPASALVVSLVTLLLPQNRGVLVYQCIDSCAGVCDPDTICQFTNNKHNVCGCSGGYRDNLCRSG